MVRRVPGFCGCLAVISSKWAAVSATTAALACGATLSLNARSPVVVAAVVRCRRCLPGGVDWCMVADAFWLPRGECKSCRARPHAK